MQTYACEIGVSLFCTLIFWAAKCTKLTGHDDDDEDDTNVGDDDEARDSLKADTPLLLTNKTIYNRNAIEHQRNSSDIKAKWRCDGASFVLHDNQETRQLVNVWTLPGYL